MLFLWDLLANRKRRKKEEWLTSLGMFFEAMTCAILLPLELVLRYKELCYACVCEVEGESREER